MTATTEKGQVEDEKIKVVRMDVEKYNLSKDLIKDRSYERNIIYATDLTQLRQDFHNEKYYDDMRLRDC